MFGITFVQWRPRSSFVRGQGPLRLHLRLADCHCSCDCHPACLHSLTIMYRISLLYNVSDILGRRWSYSLSCFNDTNHVRHSQSFVCSLMKIVYFLLIFTCHTLDEPSQARSQLKCPLVTLLIGLDLCAFYGKKRIRRFQFSLCTCISIWTNWNWSTHYFRFSQENRCTDYGDKFFIVLLTRKKVKRYLEFSTGKCGGRLGRGGRSGVGVRPRAKRG